MTTNPAATVVLLIALAGCGGDDSKEAGDTPPLESAQTECIEMTTESASPGQSDELRIAEVLEVSDGGKTLTVAATEAEGDVVTIRTYFALTCVLGKTDAPDAIIAELQSTTALMGRQSVEWNGFSMKYSYDGDYGFNAIITEAGG